MSDPSKGGAAAEDTTRTWWENADEFQALSKQGVDVRLAVLVATSVERTGQGARSTSDIRPKSSPVEFAAKASTSDKRVIRHLDAWNACAAEGWCKPSADLRPGDAADPDLATPTEDQFFGKFDANKSGGRPRASIREIARRVGADPEYADKLDAAIREAKGQSAHEEVAHTIEQDADPERTAAEVVKNLGPLGREAVAKAVAKDMDLAAEVDREHARHVMKSGGASDAAADAVADGTAERREMKPTWWMESVSAAESMNLAVRAIEAEYVHKDQPDRVAFAENAAARLAGEVRRFWSEKVANYDLPEPLLDLERSLNPPLIVPDTLAGIDGGEVR